MWQVWGLLLPIFFFSINKKSFIHSFTARDATSKHEAFQAFSAAQAPRVPGPGPGRPAGPRVCSDWHTARRHACSARAESAAGTHRQQLCPALLGSVLLQGQPFGFSKTPALVAPLSPPVPVFLNTHCRGSGGLPYNSAWLALTQKGRYYHVEL